MRYVFLSMVCLTIAPATSLAQTLDITQVPPCDVNATPPSVPSAITGSYRLEVRPELSTVVVIEIDGIHQVWLPILSYDELPAYCQRQTITSIGKQEFELKVELIDETHAKLYRNRTVVSTSLRFNLDQGTSQFSGTDYNYGFFLKVIPFGRLSAGGFTPMIRNP